MGFNEVILVDGSKLYVNGAQTPIFKIKQIREDTFGVFITILPGRELQIRINGTANFISRADANTALIAYLQIFDTGNGLPPIYNFKESTLFEDLPTANQAIGDTYNILNSFTINSTLYQAGTDIAWNGLVWAPLASKISRASQVLFDNTGTQLVSTNTESAIKEVNANSASETWVTGNFIPKTALKSNFSTVPLNTDVPSEKLVKDELDKKELLANKAVDFSVVNDMKYPTTKAVNDRLLNLPIKELENQSLNTVFESIIPTYWYDDLTDNKLPNGIRNDIVEGIYYQRVQEYVIQESDITLITSTTNVDYIAISALSGMSTSSYPAIADHIVEGFTTYSGSTNDFDTTDLIGHSIHSASQGDDIYLIVAKDTYADLTSAQTALAGTAVYYQLETPVETNLTLYGLNNLTTAQMDYWFNVYQALLVSDTNVFSIIQNYASKTLEAWITPTLTDATSTYIRYRKDTLGTVIVEGDITVTTTGTNLTLPVGYRPLFAYTVGILTFNTDGTVVSSATGTQTLSVRYTGA